MATRHFVLAWIVFGLLLGPPPPAAADERVTIAGVRSFSEYEPGTVNLKEIYRRVGVELKIERLPAERALRLANEGVYDGDLQRIDAVKNLYKNLIQVRPPINYLEASAFSVKHDFPVADWESLRPYRIGIIRGMKFADINTKGMNRVEISDYESMLRMLDLGRIEVGVLPRINGLYQRIKFGRTAVRELKPPLVRIHLFHCLHEKNKALVARLSAVITAMHETGELAAMREKAAAMLLKGAKPKP